MRKRSLISILSIAAFAGGLAAQDAHAEKIQYRVGKLRGTRGMPGVIFYQPSNNPAAPRHSNEVVKSHTVFLGPAVGFSTKVDRRIDARGYVPEAFGAAFTALQKVNGTLKGKDGKPLNGDVPLGQIGDGTARMMLRVVNGKANFAFVRPFYAETVKEARQKRKAEVAAKTNDSGWLAKAMPERHQKKIADAKTSPVERGLAVLQGQSCTSSCAVLTDSHLRELDKLPARRVRRFLQRVAAKVQSIADNPDLVYAKPVDKTMRYFR